MAKPRTFRRPRAAVAAVLLLLLLAGSLTGCSPAHPDRVAGTVDHAGLALQLDDVQAVAPAGVAPLGTSTLLQHDTHRLTATLPALKPIGRTIRLALAHDRQPETPITLRFTLNKAAIPADHGGFGVLTQSVGQRQVSIVPGRYDPSRGVLTVTMTHLSWIQPITMAVGDFLGHIPDTVLTAFKAEYPAPDCESSTVVRATTIRFPPDYGIHPCLADAGDGTVELTLHARFGIPIRITTTPAAKGTEQAGATVDSAAVLALLHASRRDDTVREILPGGTVTYRFDLDHEIQRIGIDSDIDTMRLIWAAAVLKALFDQIPLAKLTDALDCISDINDAKNLAREPSVTAGVWIRTFLNCGGQIAGELGPVGLAWTLLSAAPTAVFVQGIDLLNHLTGQAHGSIPIASILHATQIDKETYRSDESIEGLDTAYGFDSPSHNISCGIYVGTLTGEGPRWACFVYHYDFSDPPAPDHCDQEVSYGGLIVGYATGEADNPDAGHVRYPCYGGVEVPGQYAEQNGAEPNPVLDWGQQITVGDIRCITLPTAGETISCSNITTRAGFTLSRSGYTLRQPSR